MTMEEYVNQPWYTTLELDTCEGVPCFVARNPELGSCIGQGDTPEEALDELKSARTDLISVMLDCGDTIPPPERWNQLMQKPPTIASLDVSVSRPAPIPQLMPSVAYQVA